jgi:hypothetical protein
MRVCLRLERRPRSRAARGWPARAATPATARAIARLCTGRSTVLSAGRPCWRTGTSKWMAPRMHACPTAASCATSCASRGTRTTCRQMRGPTSTPPKLLLGALTSTQMGACVAHRSRRRRGGSLAPQSYRYWRRRAQPLYRCVSCVRARVFSASRTSNSDELTEDRRVGGDTRPSTN